jgi:hypothetical protein
MTGHTSFERGSIEVKIGNLIIYSISVRSSDERAKAPFLERFVGRMSKAPFME